MQFGNIKELAKRILLSYVDKNYINYFLDYAPIIQIVNNLNHSPKMLEGFRNDFF